MTTIKTHGTNTKVVTVVAIFIVGLVLLGLNSKKTPPLPIDVTTEKENENVVKKTGVLSLRKQNDRMIAALNEPFDMVITADTLKSPILGFDAVVNFDESIVKLTEVKGIDKRFDIISTKQKGQTIITGTTIAVEKGVTLDATPLVLLTFTPLKQGQAKIKLFKEGEKSNKDSNLIDSSDNDILNSVESQQTYIGKKITVGMKETDVDGTILNIINVIAPEAGCVDCVTTVNMLVQKKPNQQRLSFETGGIEGRAIEPERAFETLYEIGEISKTGVVVYYTSDL